MPMYGYKCNVCDSETFKILNVEDRNNITGDSCFVCKTGHLERIVVNPILFRLKGGGWAASGYSHNIGEIEAHTGKQFEPLDED